MKRFVLPLLASAVLALGSTPAWAEPPPGDDDPVLAADVQPGYQAQQTCSPAPKPGAVALLDLLVGRWGGSSWGISRGCDVGGRSEHKEGRALDWHMDAGRPADRQRVAEALDWLTADNGAVARQLGVMYIIWDQKVWASYRRSAGWRPMSDRGSYTANHHDHVHISLTWDGAMQQTSWWTGVPVTHPLRGPCGLDAAPACRPSTARALEAMLPGSADEPIPPESLPAPAATPLVGGKAMVGHLLQVVPGTWVPEGAELAFQWIKDGIPVPAANAPTYAITPLDLGAVLRVRVIAFAADGSVDLRLSDDLPAVAPAAFRTVPVPAILGQPAVGRLLSVDPGGWRPFPAALAFQWFRDGRPIPGDTGSIHALTRADQGHRISVAVTATAPGFAATTTTSAPSPTVRQAALVVPTPVVSGERVQGRTLTAVPGDWGPGRVRLAYQWFRDGTPIRAATRPSYRLVEADVGAVVRVRVRGSKAGYGATSVMSVADRAVRPAPEPTAAPATPSPTPSDTPTASPTPSDTPSTPSPAPPTPSDTPSPTPSDSPTPTPTPARASQPAAATPTPSTPTPTPTESAEPADASPTAAVTTSTPTPTPTETAEPADASPTAAAEDGTSTPAPTPTGTS